MVTFREISPMIKRFSFTFSTKRGLMNKEIEGEITFTISVRNTRTLFLHYLLNVHYILAYILNDVAYKGYT